MSKRASTSSQSGPVAKKRSRQSTQADRGHEVSAGRLLHIALRNFMCHGNFKLDFNPRMNFILGHNGSGKSGILTAIIVGLGGSAKATNRSSSISKLVKNGESSAVIEIHICNRGADAFEPENYGDRIIVVRTIMERGGGHYKILNADREVVTKSKSKLDVILRYFEITVNNPITILTQDCARTFLRDSDAKARFKLFKKGCGLESIEEEMASCLEIQRSVEIELKRRKDKSKYFRDEYKEKMRIYEMLESAEKARERTVKLDKELKWVGILKQEKALNKLQHDLEKRVSTMNKFTGEVAEMDKKKEALEQSISLLNNEVAKVESGRASHELLVAGKKQAMQEKRNEFFSVRKRFLGIEGRVKQAKADIRQIEESIAEIAGQESREQFEREVAELEQQKADVEQEMSSKSAEMQDAQNRISEMEEKLVTLQQTKNSLSRSVAICREQMNNIQNETDNLAVYGSHIPQFVKLLERNAAKFSTPPLGPIGRYIEVPNERYKGIIEHLTSSCLGSFIVNSPSDHEVFLNLFNRNFPGQRCPGILQRKFRKELFDVSQHAVHPPRNTTTPMEQMRCHNAVVMNTIIDMVRIEQILICEDMETGRKLTENVENVPRNLKRVIVMNPLCEVYPQPNFRIYSLTAKRCNFIQVSAKEKRVHLKEKFDEENGKFEELKNTFAYTENLVRELKQSRQEMRARVTALEKQKRNLTGKIADIRDTHLGPRIEEDTLLEEKQRLVEKLEELTVDYAPQKAKMDELTAQLEEIDADIKRTERLGGESEAKLEEARDRVNAIRQKLHRLEDVRSDQARTLRELQQRVTAAERQVEQQQSAVDQLVAAAGCERMETTKTEEEVREEISRLNAQRQVSTQITETREEIMVELEALEEKIGELNKQFEAGKETLRVQVAALDRHTREYEQRKKVVKRRMSERFREILAQQSYSGDIKVNYDTETLELEINPRQSGTVQGTKSLSGGERSFSTVAFLLSIWSCIEHPFFLLDEYDVFTDGSNRELMTRMLIQEAMAKPKNQYMFLTPQDVSHLIKPSAELEVFKMPDKN